MIPCERKDVDRWSYDRNTQQMRTLDDDDDCLDVSGGAGPVVTWYGCHNMSDPRVSHQQFILEKSASSFRLGSVSSEVKRCVDVISSIPNDSGTSLWFPYDHNVDGKVKLVYAIATFGELRGGNLSLVSSTDMSHWTFEKVILKSRTGKWDDGAMSVGPSPQRLSDGNWLVLYDIDRLFPVRDPKPLPKFGRCALGWFILDQHNLTNVLARADVPLVAPELPWERKGYTDMVVYVTNSSL